MTITLYNADCLEMIPCLQDKFRLVLCDLPYGITACDWDKKIDLVKFWEVVKPILTEDGSVVMFASQPFTSELVMSNRKMFKYCWVWQKHQATGQLNAKRKPMPIHEDIVVFQSTTWYNPQMGTGKPYKHKVDYGKYSQIYGHQTLKGSWDNKGTRYPTTVLKYQIARKGRLHTSEKPQTLLEYLIKTYTDIGDNVLDPTMGSGSTGEACKNTNRNFVGIEMSEDYYEIARKRLL